MKKALLFAALVAVAAVSIVPLAGQAAKKAYKAPRTPWGDPDLQGTWPGTDYVGVPLQRASNFGTRNELTEEEFKARQIAAQRQTDEDRSLYDQCITRGVLGSILPVIYNNGNQIIQAPGLVVLRNEMIHETRFFYLDGRPHRSIKIRTYMGDSRGRWDGDTLVVETTNMFDRNGVGGNGGGQAFIGALTITEKFTRMDADTLEYSAIVDDAKTYTRPFTIQFPWRRDNSYGMYEYACHEGNHSLFNILSGARADDRAASSSNVRP